MQMHIKDIFKILCLSEPALLKINGTINQNAVERATGINQTTIKRILDGDSRQPKDSNILKIADYFSITLPQARGDEPLPERFLNSYSKDDNKVASSINTIHDDVARSRNLTSSVQYIYQTLLSCSDKIDRKSADDIVDYIRYKVYQMDNKKV